MNPTTLLWCATFVAACAASNTPPTPAEADRIVAARNLLDREPDRSLDLAEQLLAENPDLREARLVAAEGSMRLAQSGRAPVDLHWTDAANNFEKALDGLDDTVAPVALRMLAECRYALGDFERGSLVAQRAAKAFDGLDLPEARRDAASARLIAGRCELALFVRQRQAELDEVQPDKRGRVPAAPDTQALASVAASQFAAARRELPGEAITGLALIHRWLGDTAAVVQELERGIHAYPAANQIHDAYIEWMRDNGQWDSLLGGYARFVRERPDTPILRWHQGRALYARAFQLRQDGNFQGAYASYEKADATFAAYAESVRSHLASANQWRALCRLGMAQNAIDTGKLAEAASSLLLAGRLSPAVVDEVAGDAQAYARTAFAIHRAVAESGDGALDRTLAFNEDLLQQHPDRWGFVYNNAALAARDLGVQKAKAGDDAAAKQLWERSYAHYRKAVELSPDDARIVNDCALMLIYHLDRDLDQARELCDRAIELGKKQLAALGKDADPRERERIEECVGDAYQNIAVLLREQQKQPFDVYKPFCEEAVKYYPYQRREAAALLRQQGASELGSTARTDTAARLAKQQGGGAEALAKQRSAVDAMVAAGDVAGALVILDGLAKDCRDHAPYHLLRGELTLRLAKGGGRRAGLLFEDAVSALKRAVELDPEPAAPRQLLAEAMYETGDTAGAVEQLSKLLLHLQSQGGGKPEDVLAAHALRAKAASRVYIDKKQNNQDDQEMLTAARASFRLLEEKGKLLEDLQQAGGLEGSLLQAWSTTEQWAGAGAEAVNVYVRALAKAPDDANLLGALLATAYGQTQMPLAVDALARRTDANGLFYLGEARFWLADAERATGKTAEPLQTLDAARAAFEASMQKNPEYRPECEKRLAKCLGKKGSIAVTANDTANAEKWLLESARLRPECLLEDLGSQDSTKRSLLILVDKFLKKRDLAKVEAISRAAADAANSDVDLLNNAGLFARDHGNQLEDAGKKKEAAEMYEQSYKVYRRAQQLDPASVRLRNDCALIAIYHLDRDWDLSKQWLDGAIADGEKTLRDNPPDDANDRQQLDEAVGDCYENLALWHLRHSKDAAAAKAAAQKSPTFFPRERRPGARRHLAAAERMLQGK